jgi:hypothetical protein
VWPLFFIVAMVSVSTNSESQRHAGRHCGVLFHGRSDGGCVAFWIFLFPVISGGCILFRVLCMGGRLVDMVSCALLVVCLRLGIPPVCTVLMGVLCLVGVLLSYVFLWSFFDKENILISWRY